MRNREHITTGISRADLSSSIESDRKKKIISATIEQNMEAILSGQYTTENLLQDTGLFNKIGALINFLNINYTTSSLKQIAKGLQKPTETPIEQKPTQEQITITYTNVQEMVFGLFNQGSSRRDVNKKLQELVAQGQLPNTPLLLKICKGKTLTDLVNTLYSKWDANRAQR